MIKVGLTGGIGSGKSLISSMFSRLGMPVYDSDSATKKLYQTDLVLKNQLIKLFGEQCYLETGELNTTYLGQLVFKDKTKLEQLNQLVHPRVKLDFETWVLENKLADYIIKEAAILIESGAYKHVDKIIVVTTPLELRISRVMKRDNSNLQSVSERIRNQLPEEELLKHADFVIINNGKQAVLPQVIDIHQQLLKMLH